jgi:ABC-type Na+ efflux pump permease subunit
MSTSRIEIPLTLQPPHFDDDATIATARQVVPIKGGRKIEGRRKVLVLLPLLLASTLCGALGAIAVNYFERRDAVTSVTQQQPNVSTQAKTEPPPAAIAPELNAKKTAIQTPVQPENSSVTTADEPSQKSEAPKIANREDTDRKSAPNAEVKREADQDAAKLVRKRRVQQANSEIPLRRNRRTDAGRIEDLFTGPNP